MIGRPSRFAAFTDGDEAYPKRDGDGAAEHKPHCIDASHMGEIVMLERLFQFTNKTSKSFGIT